MKPIPILPTIVVLVAVAIMVALGVWQARKVPYKRHLIAQFEANSRLPPIAWPTIAGSEDKLLYRRAHGFCLQVVGWRAVAGRSRANEPGWSHIAACRTGGLEGPGMQVDIGWSTWSKEPAWKGGPVSGLIVPDSKHKIRLIADDAPPGLKPSMAPRPDMTPNNHLAYAIQWFAFALTALVIYGLALRRRLGPVAAEPPST
jgi:cytochrome oxidase assembly protein ShyY1